MAERLNGTVVRKIEDKGFGFIKDDSGKEFFFHSSGVRDRGWDNIQTGDKVTFLRGMGPKGPRAEDIEPV